MTTAGEFPRGRLEAAVWIGRGREGVVFAPFHYGYWDTTGDAPDGHADEPDIHFLCLTLAQQCDSHVQKLLTIVDRYGEQAPDNEPERLNADSLSETRSGPVGLLRDLQDVHMLATLVESTWTLVAQGGSALRD